MDSPKQGLRHFLSKRVGLSYTQQEVIWQKEFLKSMHWGKSTKMAKFFGTFVRVWFQKFSLPNDFLLNVMKDLLHTFTQKVS